MNTTLTGYDEWLVSGEPGNQPDPEPLPIRLLRYMRHYCYGQHCAQSREDIGEWFGVNERTVREHFETLREKGHPIGALSTGGYYYATPDEETEALAEYDKSLYRRLQIRNRMARNIPGATGLQLVLAEADGQGRLIA